MEARQRLVNAIADELERRGDSYSAIERIWPLRGEKVSALKKRRAEEFGLDRLIGIASQLGLDPLGIIGAGGRAAA